MAENFDIAKFLRENALGSYGILGKYVDLQPLKEVDKDSGYDDDENNQYDGKYDDESGPAIANENDSFIQAQRDAASGFESEDHDRMMGLIDQSIISKLPLLKKAVDLARTKGLSNSAIFNMLSSNSLVSKSVNDLVDDGFDSQDIVDFFGTDFSANEEVSVSSSGGEMEEGIDMNEYADYTSAEEFDIEPQEGPNDPLGPNASKYPRADFADAVYAANQAGISKDELIILINQNAR
jgi:hypothetical protein